MLTIWLLLLSATLTLANCGSIAGELTDLIRDVSIDGFSPEYPRSEEFLYEHHKVKRNISGTGSGFKKFTRDETDINDASGKTK